MMALLEHPDQLKLLAEQPELTTNAIEEFLRYDNPVDTAIPRFAKEDIELGGARIRAGDAIHFSLASANRDLPVTGDPDTLDITRADIRHMGFAHGIHFCLGAPLARLEGQIAFRTLLDNCTDFALAVDREQIKRKPSPFTRSLTHLPVTFVRRPATDRKEA
jgi:cytochrome P450